MASKLDWYKLHEIKEEFERFVAYIRATAENHPSREMSIVLTNLDTAKLWLDSIEGADD